MKGGGGSVWNTELNPAALDQVGCCSLYLTMHTVFLLCSNASPRPLALCCRYVSSYNRDHFSWLSLAHGANCYLSAKSSCLTTAAPPLFFADLE